MRVHLPFVTSRFANVEVIHTVETIPTVTGTLNAAVAAVTAVRVSTRNTACCINGDIGIFSIESSRKAASVHKESR